MMYDTRGNRYKFVPKLCKYKLRKQCFVDRLVKLWNMLPDEVVLVGSVNTLKRRLDGFWCSPYFYYDCTADM